MNLFSATNDGFSGNVLNTPAAEKYFERRKWVPNTFQVQHGYFKWSIENFFALPVIDGLACDSPSFKLRETWWHFTFCPSDEYSGRNCISFELFRDTTDPGPDSVLVSCRFGLKFNNLDNIWFAPEEKAFPGKSDSVKLRAFEMGSLYDFFRENVKDKAILTVLCEIYVSYFSSGKYVDVSQVDECLPSDLVALYKSHATADVCVETEDDREWAHKSVLSARSRTLAKMLENGESVIKLSCSASCMRCALYYMYSGSLPYAEKDRCFISTGLYELADKLSLLYLKYMLTPYEVEGKSCITIQMFKGLYSVNTFGAPGKIIEILQTQNEDDSLIVKFRILREDFSPTVAIEIEVEGIINALCAHIRVALFKKKGTLLKNFPREIYRIFPNIKGSFCVFRIKISNRKYIDSLTAASSVYAKVSCSIHSLINAEDERNLPSRPIAPPSYCLYHMEYLSADIRQLLETSQLSDITLVVGKHEFKAHRSILAARSHSFFCHFNDRNNSADRMSIKGTEPRIFGIMLMYIYCGTLSHVRDLTIEDFHKLFEASITFNITSLMQLCAIFLRFFDTAFQL